MITPPKHPLPYTIVQKLDEARQLLRGYLTKQWLCMTIIWLLLVFWIGAVIDYLPVRVGSSETPRSVRIAMICALGIGAAWLLLGWLWPRLRRPIDDSSLALLIERQHPELENSLITSVQVARLDNEVSDPEAHEQMFTRVLEQAERAIATVDLTQLFRWKPLRVIQAVAIFGLVATSIVALINWSWFAQWNMRLFALSDRPWPRSAVLRADWLQLPMPTFTGQLTGEQIRVEFENGFARLPAGSSPRLQVSADAAAPKLPEVCTMRYRNDEGVRGRANLRRIGAPRDGWQQFNLDGPPLDLMSSSLTIDIVGLDARIHDLRLEVIEPVIVVELQLSCKYPSYLLDSLSTRPKQEVLPYRSGMKIPEGTECTMIGRCSSSLSQVEFVRQTPGGPDVATGIKIEKAETKNEQFEIALGALMQSQLIEIRLRDLYGLPAEQVLRYNLVVQPDTVPEVQSRLEGIGLAITPNANLPVRGKVTDDHGIADVAAELSFNETMLPSFPLKLDDTALSGEIDLAKLAVEKQFNIPTGITIGLSVRARDRYDLGGGEHLGRGQPQQLSVVKPETLLTLLDRQELELRQRLEQIISELQQMKDVLENLVEQLTELETAQLIRPSIFVATQELAPQTDQANQAKTDQQAERQAQQRLVILKAQQCQLQADKSRQELAGVASRVENLRLQLVNNRIDSVDRQQRLQDQVEKPLVALLDGEYKELDRQLGRLQAAVGSGRGRQPADLSAKSADQILMALESIKESMLDFESFNEIVDLLRDLLDEQNRILNETEEAQKARVLDIFK